MAEEHTQEHMHPSFARVIREREMLKERLKGIKHRIGVYSAKGGVGKTTVAVNIAYALKKRGYKVGLLDADIDCPNLAMFLGIEEKMDVSGLPLKPLVKEGVKVASTAMLVDEAKRPIIWRGPLVTKMLTDFFMNTDWGELDYLIMDLSPGTSDSPLTIMQLLQMDGFVIITTPQRIAAINSIRSGSMAKRLNVGILGVVENMANGEVSENAKEVAKSLGTDILGSVPLEKAFNSYSDSGKIPVLEDEGIAKLFDSIVDRLT